MNTLITMRRRYENNQTDLSVLPSCVAITCFQNVSKCGEDSMPSDHYYNKVEKVQFSVVQLIDPG